MDYFNLLLSFFIGALCILVSWLWGTRSLAIDLRDHYKMMFEHYRARLKKTEHLLHRLEKELREAKKNDYRYPQGHHLAGRYCTYDQWLKATTRLFDESV